MGIERRTEVSKHSATNKTPKIFISHAHSDHILGLINIFRKIGFMALNEEYSKKLNIYCNDYVYEAITNVAKYILPDKLMEYVYKVVNFIILKDSDKHIINGVEYTFFDLGNKNVKIYGFECFLGGKRLVFLGDINPSDEIKDRIADADYVMVESFCLDSEEDIFHAHIGNHSTVKDGDIKIEDVTTDIIDAILEVDNLQDGITVRFLGDATWNTTMFIIPNTSNNYRIIITYNRILK